MGQGGNRGMFMAEDGAILTLIMARLEEVAVNQRDLQTQMRESERLSTESRRRVHEKQDVQNQLLLKLDHRLSTVEKAVEAEAPTWAEFRALKARAAGAGSLGRAIWKVGAWVVVVVGAFYALRNDIAAFWQWLMSR